jgi:hypothetical protein
VSVTGNLPVSVVLGVTGLLLALLLCSFTSLNKDIISPSYNIGEIVV